MRKLKESEMVNQWMWNEHRTSLQWRRVRLGIVPNHEMAREYMVLLRWADAVFIEDGVVYIVEAKLRPTPTAFGQLELYQDLFRQTPEFAAYKNWPIKLVFLTTFIDLALVELASKKGIDYVVFDQKPLIDPSQNV